MGRLTQRLVAFFTLALSATAICLAVWAISKNRSWSEWHAAAGAVLLLGLLMAAWQWRARAFRVFASCAVALTLVAVVDVGRSAYETAETRKNISTARELNPRISAAEKQAAEGRSEVLSRVRQAISSLDPVDRAKVQTAVEAALNTSTAAELGRSKEAVKTAALSSQTTATRARLDALAVALGKIVDEAALREAVATAHEQVKDLCLESGGEPQADQADAKRPACLTTGSKPSTRTPRMDRAVADHAVAHVLALAEPGSTDRKKAVDDKAEHVKVAAKEDEAARSSTEVLAALQAGANELAEKSGTSDVPSVLPEPVVWWLLLVLAAYGYRQLEILNSGLEPGPVTVEGTGEAVGPAPNAPASGDGKESNLNLVQYAVQKNLPEPGLVPGSQSLASVTDIAGADAQGKVVTTVLRVLHLIGLPARGYIVRTSMLSPAPGETSYVCSVRVLAVRTKETLWTGEARGDSARNAALLGGATAASWILDQARAVPPWLKYRPEAAAAVFGVPGGGGGGAEGLGALKRAVAADPTAGSLLVQLGYAYSLQNDPVRALECYERACSMFPQYYLARYRASCAWAAVADLVHLLDEAEKDLLRRYARLPHDVNVDAAVCLGRARVRLGKCGTWRRVSAFVPLPRFDRLGMPRRPWRGKDGQRLARAARWCIDVRDDERRENALWELRLEYALKYLGNESGSGASAGSAYNMACAFGRAVAVGEDEHRGRCLDVLWTALTRRDSEKLTLDWLLVDSDLRAVQDDPGFARVTEFSARVTS